MSKPTSDRSISGKAARRAAIAAVALASATLLLGAKCSLFNKPPIVPIVTGPATGTVREVLSYSIVAEDPNGDSVAILVDWGDGTPMNWWAFLPSGHAVEFIHTYYGARTYAIRAMARDRSMRESAWSDSLVVDVDSAQVFR